MKTLISLSYTLTYSRYGIKMIPSSGMFRLENKMDKIESGT